MADPIQRAQIKSSLHIMDVLSYITNAMQNLKREPECSANPDAKCDNVWDGEKPYPDNIPVYLPPDLRDQLKPSLTRLNQPGTPSAGAIRSAYLPDASSNADLKSALTITAGSNLDAKQKAQAKAAFYLMDTVSYITRSMSGLLNEPECKTPGATCDDIWNGSRPDQNIPGRIAPNAAAVRRLFKLARSGAEQGDLRRLHLTDVESDRDLRAAVCKVSVVDANNAHPFCPGIFTLTPQKMSQGTSNVIVTLTGINLPKNGVIKFYSTNPTTGEKVEDTSLQPVAGSIAGQGNAVTFKINIPAGAAVGKRSVKIFSPDKQYSAEKVDALEIAAATAVQTGRVNPGTVAPGQKATFKVAFNKELPLLNRDDKNPYGRIVSVVSPNDPDLFPQGIRISFVTTERKSITAEEVTIPAGAKNGKYKFALLNDKGVKVAEFEVTVEKKKTFWEKLDETSRKWNLRGILQTGVSGVDKHSPFEDSSFTLRTPLLDEDRSLANLRVHLSFAPRVTKPKYELGFNLGLNYEQNFHEGRDTYRWTLPQATIDGKWKPSKYFQPFASVRLDYTDQQSHLPTYFHPDSRETNYQLMAGIESKFSIIRLRGYFRSSWLLYNRNFNDGAGNPFHYPGTQETHSGGMEFTGSFNKKVRGLPNLTLAGEGGAGRMDVLLYNTYNGQEMGRQIFPTKVTTGGFRATLDWNLSQNVNLYLTGDYYLWNYANWMRQEEGSVGLGLRTKAGDFEGRYRRLNLDVNSRDHLDQGEFYWRSPWRTVSVGVFGNKEHGGASSGGATVALALDGPARQRRSPIKPEEEEQPAAPKQPAPRAGQPGAAKVVGEPLKGEEVDDYFLKQARAFKKTADDEKNPGKKATNYRVALALFGRIVDPAKLKDPAVLMDWALCYQNLSDFGNALIYYRKAFVEAKDANMTRNISYRISECEKAKLPAAEMPADAAKRLNAEGNKLYEQKRYAAAEQKYAAALKLEPNNSILRSDYGWALYMQDKPNLAAEAFGEAIKLNKDNFSAQVGMLTLKWQAGKYSDALPYALECVRIKPNNAPTYSDLFNIYSKLGKIDDAVAAYKKASGLDSNKYPKKADADLGAEALIAYGLEFQKSGGLRLAVKRFDEAIKLKPSNEVKAKALFNRSLAELAQRKKWAAGVSRNAAIKLNPELGKAEHPLKPAPAAFNAKKYAEKKCAEIKDISADDKGKCLANCGSKKSEPEAATCVSEYK
jgi:tetratricopeptide (TPR) repeat protein